MLDAFLYASVAFFLAFFVLLIICLIAVAIESIFNLGEERIVLIIIGIVILFIIWALVVYYTGWYVE